MTVMTEIATLKEQNVVFVSIKDCGRDWQITKILLSKSVQNMFKRLVTFEHINHLVELPQHSHPLVVNCHATP